MKLLAKKRHVTCYCDFCGRSDNEVPKMVDGKHAFICSGCVEAALALIRAKLGVSWAGLHAGVYRNADPYLMS
jgi:ClpX C4-type zinc finger